MARLRFGVLGTLEVLVDGRPVRVPAGRRRAVLTCLLVHAGSPVAADTLVEAAWGEDPPADPRAALHTVVSRLRALLGPDAVATVGPGYRLPVPPAEVDALLLEDLLTRARTADPGTALLLLERARRLWRGPPFGELGSGPSVLAAAVRLEGMRHEVAQLHASALLDLGEPARAVPLLEELLAEEPYREHAVALLVRALYRLGRQADALDLLDRHRRRMAHELGLDPAPELVDLQAQVLGQELEQRDPAVVGEAPDRPPVTWLAGAAPLVGREDELGRLVGAVIDGPVTTVTGPGGVGKTRLAAEAVRALTDRSRLPVAVVELAGTDPGGVAPAVAGALRLGRRTEEAAETVVEVLATSPHVLVVDEAEHLLAEVADLVGLVARRCRGTHVLVTSRRRLGLPEETVIPLAPLATPSAGAEGAVDTSAAVRLFTDRVRRLRPAFGVAPPNAAAVAELCRRLDGLPLALELAASRTATVGLEEVLALLPADGAAAPGAPSDGLGLDRTVDWSYRLLDEEQRRLLAVLSVFAGEFTPAAVRAVTAYLDPRSDPGAALAELVETSLVSSRVQGRGTRLRLLGVVREYAAARLGDAGPEAQSVAHRAHAAWVARECELVADAWATDDGAVLRDRLERLVPEAMAALRRTTLPSDVGRDDLVVALRIAAAVGRCLHWVPGPALGEAMLEVAERGADRLAPRDLSDDERAAAGGVGAGAMVAVEHGELDRARRLALAGIELAGGADEPLACLALGVEAMYRGDAAASTDWFERTGRTPEATGETHASRALMALYADDLTAAREHLAVATAVAGAGSDAARAFTLYAEGEVLARSDPAEATVRLREAATEAGRIGAAQVSKVARLALVARLVRDGQREEARSLGGSLLRDLHRTGSWAQIWTMLRVLAELLVDEGASADAAFLLGAAENDPSAPPLMGEDVGRHAALRQRLADELGPAVLRRIQEVAATTPRGQVVRRALRLLP